MGLLGKKKGKEEENEKSSSSSRRWKKWVIFRRMKMESWRLKFLGSGFKWKRVNLKMTFMQDLLFKIASVFEAFVLVATLCFYFLCCGCHI